MITGEIQSFIPSFIYLFIFQNKKYWTTASDRAGVTKLKHILPSLTTPFSFQVFPRWPLSKSRRVLDLKRPEPAEDDYPTNQRRSFAGKLILRRRTRGKVSMFWLWWEETMLVLQVRLKIKPKPPTADFFDCWSKETVLQSDSRSRMKLSARKMSKNCKFLIEIITYRHPYSCLLTAPENNFLSVSRAILLTLQKA